MQVMAEINPVQTLVRERQANRRTVAVVPTMGALHRGHGELIRRAVDQCDDTIVTVFLNPTQFAAGEDLSRYPRPIDDDLALCESLGAAAVFTPTPDTMYPSGEGTSINPPPVAEVLEGQHRPLHYRGVCTVVAKLFGIVPADVAYFGKKDYQQWRVIDAMVRDLNIPIDVRGVDIVRDDDGLALSSRNVYLDADQRRQALSLSASLETARSMAERGETAAAISSAMHKQLADVDSVDYAIIADRQTLQPVTDDFVGTSVALVAAHVGATRLIDNVEL